MFVVSKQLTLRLGFLFFVFFQVSEEGSDSHCEIVFSNIRQDFNCGSLSALSGKQRNWEMWIW